MYLLHGLLCEGLAIRLAVFTTKPSEVLGNAHARDLIDRDVIELSEDDLQNVGIHGDCGGAVGAIPHTEREPHILHKFPEGHAWSLGSGSLTSATASFFFLSLLDFGSGAGGADSSISQRTATRSASFLLLALVSPAGGFHVLQ